LLALNRVRTVTSYQGYIAVLAGFATEMGDSTSGVAQIRACHSALAQDYRKQARRELDRH
jgi:hypothetical protein